MRVEEFSFGSIRIGGTTSAHVSSRQIAEALHESSARPLQSDERRYTIPTSQKEGRHVSREQDPRPSLVQRNLVID